MRTRVPNETVETQTWEGQKIQRNAKVIADAVNQRGTASRVLGPITFQALQEIDIPHGLMRVPEEWWPVDITGTFGVFYKVSANDRVIRIRSGNACVAKFRVA